MIAAERRNQLDTWGTQTHDDCRWITILTEEVGEAAAEVCKAKESTALIFPAQLPEEETYAYELDLMVELVQVAAVAVAHIECILDRRPK